MTQARPTNRELHHQVVRDHCPGCRFRSIQRQLDCHEYCEKGYVEAYAEAELKREVDFPESDKPLTRVW